MNSFVHTVPSELIKTQNVNEMSQRRGALYVWTGRFVECLYATVRGNTSVVYSVASGPCREYRHKFDLRPLPNTQNQPAPFSLFAPWYWLIYTGHKIVFFLLFCDLSLRLFFLVIKKIIVSFLGIFRTLLQWIGAIILVKLWRNWNTNYGERRPRNRDWKHDTSP